MKLYDLPSRETTATEDSMALTHPSLRWPIKNVRSVKYPMQLRCNHLLPDRVLKGTIETGVDKATALPGSRVHGSEQYPRREWRNFTIEVTSALHCREMAFDAP